LSKNSTEPVGAPAALDTVVRKVTFCPYVDGVNDDMTGVAIVGTGFGFTVNTTVAVFDVVAPSDTEKVKSSIPLKCGAGVYRTPGPVPDKVPCAGAVMVNVNGFPS
jgi:hypothetical protein